MNWDLDKKIGEELLQDPKERAEHLMLVDLGRNDLGRVCEAGSVAVVQFMQIERYSHVMHIVSTVTGKLTENKNAIDALYAVFPADFCPLLSCFHFCSISLNLYSILKYWAAKIRIERPEKRKPCR